MFQEISAAMHDAQIRKAFGARLKELRKQRGWTQKELAAKVDVQTPQLNKYEGGLHVPPADTLIKLSGVLDVTVDYLLTGDRPDNTPIRNLRLMERFRAVEAFQPDDQDAVLKLIDAMIVKHKVEGAIKTSQQLSGRQAR